MTKYIRLHGMKKTVSYADFCERDERGRIAAGLRDDMDAPKEEQ